MNDLMTTTELREELRAHLDSVTPPPADLDAVRRRGRGLRVNRFAKPGLLAAAAVGIGALVLTQTADPGGSERDTVIADEPVDLSNGLRAFASPDEAIYMGGQQLPYDAVGLDTGATTTPYGIVHYDEDGLPTLLKTDGSRVQLAEGPSDPQDGFDPTVKADALQPHIAFAIMNGEDVDVTVYDLEDRSVVASYGITCSPGCPDLVIDGIDSGAVFMRMTSGTTVWDYERDEAMRFSGRETKVADVRNGVVLYDGERPSVELEGWRYVSGAIDAQLSFDGRHVLYWSDELVSTGVRATSTIELDLPEPATFFTFDTDGSVLAATVDDPSTVFDCVLPSGECEQIAEMSTDHGDPLFIGSDG